MEDGDLNLSLNLKTSSSDIRPEKRKKQKVFGNRTERIKQRKQFKLQTQTQNELPANSKRKAAPSDVGEKDGASPAKRAKKGGQRSGVGGTKSNSTSNGPKKAEKGVLISSLFKHNPDIPTVKSKSVTEVKEEVFASAKFSDLPLHPHLISNLEQKLQLAAMTRVQQLSIPVILRERDVLIKSQTGSGKTLAYAVPIVHTLASMPRKIQRTNGPYALVIVPTRELAVQSYETFKRLLQSAVWVVAGCLMGGENRKAEKARLRKGINILVCTPGRLLDHLKHTDCLNLNRVQWLVIDEADRLLELGYEKDIAEIVTILNTRSAEERQTILMSATLTAGIERLSGMALKDHESVDASVESRHSSHTEMMSVTGSQASAFALPEKLRQHFIIVPCKLRLVTLAAFILWKCKLQTKRSKMVVFFSTQDAVDFHHQLFTQVLNTSSSSATTSPLTSSSRSRRAAQDDPLDLFRLHGDMAQKDRMEVFQDFSGAVSGVLLCTDVASRGLDLPRVDWIVQHTTPGATVDYIHRVGRTARAGKGGNALLFLMPSESGFVQELNKHEISLSELSMQDVLKTLLTIIADLPQSQTHTKRQLPRTYEEAATFMQDRFEESVMKQGQLNSVAVKGYQSFVRAYATYPSHLKEIFSMKDLHLGHVAKSFALRQSPSHLHVTGNRGRGRGRGRRSEGNPKLKFDRNSEKRFGGFQKKRPMSERVSEFGSGLDSDRKTNVRNVKPWTFGSGLQSEGKSNVKPWTFGSDSDSRRRVATKH